MSELLDLNWDVFVAPGIPTVTSDLPPGTTVVRKNSTTVMQRGSRSGTRGEVRSGRSVPQLGSIGRNDAAGVGTAPGDSGADPEGRAPRKSVVGLDCNARTTTAEFFEDGPRSRV
jgi:hypothetical protein